MLTALGAMFLQQTFASVGKVLPAVVAPLVIADLHADPDKIIAAVRRGHQALDSIQTTWPTQQGAP